MNLLYVLLILSIVLALASLFILGGLVIWRIVSTRRAAERAALRRKLLPILLGSEAPEPHTLRAHAPLVAEIYQELIGLVRGTERHEFIERALQFKVHRELIRQSRSGSRRQRARAVQALSQLDAPEVRKALHQALNDTDREVQLVAALALAALQDAPDVEELAGKLSLADGGTSLLVKSLLRQIAATQPERVKAFAFQPNQNTEILLSTLEALAANGDYSVVPVIVDHVMSAPDDAPELPRYLDMLGVLGHPAGRSAILKSLSSSCAATRQAAAKAAGRSRLLESADQLMQLLDDDLWAVRFHAANALILLGENGIEYLRRAAKNGGAIASEAASKMLAENGLEP